MVLNFHQPSATQLSFRGSHQPPAPRRSRRDVGLLPNPGPGKNFSSRSAHIHRTGDRQTVYAAKL
jgi:hypothetical protein